VAPSPKAAAIRRALLAGACALTACALHERAAPNLVPAKESSGPQWIWLAADPEGPRAWFRRSFELAGLPARAELRGSADNAAALFLNGELVAEAVRWEEPFRVDVTRALRLGRNVLAVAARNHEQQGGIWLELDVAGMPGDAGGTHAGSPTAGEFRPLVVSDARFQVAARELPRWNEPDAGAAGWQAAHALGPLGIEPWGAQTSFVDGAPGSALPAERLAVAEGFRAELLYSVPRALQGSWVALTFDERGRILTSDQYGPLYRVTLREGAEPLVEEIELPIGEAHGLCCAFGALYVVVSSDRFQSGLYRLRDTDGDDCYDELRCLKEFEGSGEHGPHGVVAGPDGKSLYLVIGNHTELPEGITRYRMPRVWGEDQLLKREPDPGGHAVGKMAPGGVVLKTDPEGKEWELVAGGLRNSYDLAFDEHGELYTYDSDMEWDVGLPWYRPTRVLHIVSGADFGWRNGSGKWSADYPDTLPSVIDLGRGSPTGVVNGNGSWFGSDWDERLFVADWADGEILAIHPDAELAPKHRKRVFVAGKPLPVTDLAFGREGALYFTTGGRNTQSGLYRIVRTATPMPRGRTYGTRALAKGLQRERRLDLERFHGRQDPSALASSWAELEYQPQAARAILENLPPSAWKELALHEENAAVAVQALVAMVHCGASEDEAVILERALDLLEVPVGELLSSSSLEWKRSVRLEPLSLPTQAYLQAQFARQDRANRLATLRVLELAFIRMGRPEPSLAARIAVKLQSMFPNDDPRLDRELVQLLVYLESPPVIEKALDLIGRAPTQEDAIAMGWPLRVMRTGWTKATRLRYFRWMHEVVPTYSGGDSFRGYMDAMLGEAQSHLTEEDLDALALELPPTAWRPGVPNVTRPFVRFWTMTDLLPELARLAPAASGPAASAGRDLERGAEAFGQVCMACHRIGSEGGSTGPDLTSAGGRFSPRDMVEAILEPSRTIPDSYRDQEVWTHDDRAWVGRIVEQDDAHVVVRTTDHELVELASDALAEIRPHPLSRMPEGLLDTYDLDEILDLVAYLLADRPAPDASLGRVR
jgi:putative heme-binding domain-containing protein